MGETGKAEDDDDEKPKTSGEELTAFEKGLRRQGENAKAGLKIIGFVSVVCSGAAYVAYKFLIPNFDIVLPVSFMIVIVPIAFAHYVKKVPILSHHNTICFFALYAVLSGCGFLNRYLLLQKTTDPVLAARMSGVIICWLLSTGINGFGAFAALIKTLQAYDQNFKHLLQIARLFERHFDVVHDRFEVGPSFKEITTLASAGVTVAEHLNDQKQVQNNLIERVQALELQMNEKADKKKKRVPDGQG